MRKSGFEGWYFKHQRGNDTIALIPGTAEGGAFMQVMTNAGARKIALPGLWKGGGCIRAQGLLASSEGLSVDLPGLHGDVRYGPLRPLKSPIMGPFRFFPMECSHEVISMRHELRGGLTVDGRFIDLTGGTGYIEKDSGVSFPKSYQWVQCNDFPDGTALMVSIARVPFCGACFRGCICAILRCGQEYRFATYRGVRILAADAGLIRLRQGRMALEITMRPTHEGHRLLAPVNSRMCGSIRESSNAAVHVRLWEGSRLILDQQSPHAAYEFVPAVAPWLDSPNADE